MQNQLESFVQSFDPLWQWVGVFLAGAVPYIESYFAAFIGIVSGVNPSIAIVMAILGNIVSMLAFVFFGERSRNWRKADEKPISKRKQKLKDRFDKYGIVSVSLLGQTLLPSQITSMAMVAFGADRKKVIFWQIISITLWGIFFGVLAMLGVEITK